MAAVMAGADGLGASSETPAGRVIFSRPERFDAHLHMRRLDRAEYSGQQDRLAEELYRMTEDDLDFYLPQLVQVALLRHERSSLQRFLLDKAAESLHFALKIHWLVQSAAEDGQPEVVESALALLSLIEAALVNSAGPKPISGERSQVGAATEQREAQTRPLTERGQGDGRRVRAAWPPAQMPLEPGPATPSAPSSGPGGGGPSRQATSGRRVALGHLAALSRAFTAGEKASAVGWRPSFPNAYAWLGEPVATWSVGNGEEPGDGALPDEELRRLLRKRRRCDYFNTQNHLVSMIMRLSSDLAAISEKEERLDCLARTLGVVNRWLMDRRVFMTFTDEGHLNLLGLHVPMQRQHDCKKHQILRIHVDQCRIFSSATRAPFLLAFEAADLDELGPEGRPAAEALAGCLAAELAAAAAEAAFQAEAAAAEAAEGCAAVSGPGEDFEEEDANPSGEERRETLERGMGLGEDCWEEPAPELRAVWDRVLRLRKQEWLRLPARAPAAPPPSPPRPRRCQRCPCGDGRLKDLEDLTPLALGLEAVGLDDGPRGAEGLQRCLRCPAFKRSEKALRMRTQIWGEPWEERAARIRKASPFGHYSSWSLDALLVKGGDDLRQEQLASQLIETFACVFREARLPLWLKATKVLVTSASSGFIEFVRNSASIDAMKKRFPGKTLAEIFRAAFADRLFEATRNFVESCAAYSLVIYFLQVKDRHNGNLMMDSWGHVIHVDFGFMLSNSPGGNMAFEQSPFKLTQEFLDVMQGERSEQYYYFRVLVIRGFLEARRHMERILLQVRMLLTGSRLPCFREGAEAVMQGLKDRCFMDLAEEECVEKVVELIEESVNNWRTIQYDNYQRIVNGIL